jgi:hypothetical protein
MDVASARVAGPELLGFEQVELVVAVSPASEADHVQMMSSMTDAGWAA